MMRLVCTIAVLFSASLAWGQVIHEPPAEKARTGLEHLDPHRQALLRVLSEPGCTVVVEVVDPDEVPRVYYYPFSRFDAPARRPQPAEEVNFFNMRDLMPERNGEEAPRRDPTAPSADELSLPAYPGQGEIVIRPWRARRDRMAEAR